MNTDVERLLARGKRITAMEMEMDALKREEEALRAEVNEAGSKEQAADIERRKAELAKRVEEENKNICESLANVKAGAVLDEQEERYWYIQACILFCRRLDLIENFLRFNFENGVSLWDKFMQAYPRLCRVSESDCFTGFCGRGTMVNRIIEERICCKAEGYLSSKQLAVLEAKRKTLVENGNTDALSGVDASINDIRNRMNRIYQRDLELGKKVRADARRSADYERESYLRKTLELEEYYAAAIEWLRSNRPADAKDEQETYWDRFIRSRPSDEIWVV